MWARRFLSSALLYVPVSVFCALVAAPFLWMFMSSLKTTREVFASPFSLPAQPQWTNFVRAWERGMEQYLLNSIIITGVSVAAIVVVSGMAAYALARLRFPGRLSFYLLLITGYAIPVHTVLVPLYELLRAANLLNSYPGLILPYVAFGIPFSILLLYAFFLEFPTELEDAAKLDGCNALQLAVHVVAPLSIPALSSVAIFQGVFIWNEFLLALLIISNDALKPLPLGLLAFQGEYATNWPVLLAALTVATLPILLIYIAAQRHFINSLTGFSK